MTPLKKTFSIDPPQGFVQTVLLRIETERIKRAKQRVAMLVGAETLSLAAVGVALQYTIKQFANSAFLRYFSLLLSDRWEVLAYWKQFLAALSESVPLVGVSIVIIAVIATLFVLKNLMQNMYHMSRHTALNNS